MSEPSTILVLSDPDGYKAISEALLGSKAKINIPNPNQQTDDFVREISGHLNEATLVVVQLSPWFLDNPTLASIIEKFSQDVNTVFFCIDTYPVFPSWLIGKKIELVCQTTTLASIRQSLAAIREHPLVSGQIRNGGRFFS
ncbi:TPA: hypothetical protein DIU27_00240 [Candidatus Collierbacteria bacterium]|uniref:Uncharacterized protein n=1 Tax=Candidatus Collierbacteria bacterium GW2011_GWB2_44_22 TaxID=1618387 RepID=A0A0G1KWW3_9BACT|nr:MAG: hypothetical protein UW31_C0004G0004 [Candidatus Collierbacteria bacterium GW2011_GWA2_44_13]KKT52424.1 MAG: hypothetical protein UW44_C0002G0090 [Candidatus Collierbacteria bacterium GW2011_GWB2_44_22]KKT62876.1 MAG: hypothetical protein UW56_C0003G0062 [Candidatus Collierbacteria bacterium GW2011_GWD1_44_27]KKT66275.1 MAG: hypothetical protein UW58_C0011G0046 [Candidatus Collierbacteria bacterium GW2011_GWC2_44_30]KKT69326.1 MAG: hypothetical protein UW64_C0002G0090 [Microgenomates gr